MHFPTSSFVLRGCEFATGRNLSIDAAVCDSVYKEERLWTWEGVGLKRRPSTSSFFILFFKKYLFIYLAVLGLSWGMPDLVP